MWSFLAPACSERSPSPLFWSLWAAGEGFLRVDRSDSGSRESSVFGVPVCEDDDSGLPESFWGFGSVCGDDADSEYVSDVEGILVAVAVVVVSGLIIGGIIGDTILGVAELASDADVSAAVAFCVFVFVFVFITPSHHRYSSQPL